MFEWTGYFDRNCSFIEYNNAPKISIDQNRDIFWRRWKCVEDVDDPKIPTNRNGDIWMNISFAAFLNHECISPDWRINITESISKNLQPGSSIHIIISIFLSWYKMTVTWHCHMKTDVTWGQFLRYHSLYFVTGIIHYSGKKSIQG